MKKFNQNTIKECLLAEAKYIGLPSPIALTIIDLYDAPNRHYHTSQHLFNVLNESNKAIPLLDPDKTRALKLSLWFHDVIQNYTKTKDSTKSDEEMSESFMRLYCGQIYSSEILNHAGKMILLTGHYSKDLTPIEDITSQIMLSCDLAILGYEKSLYDKYALNISKEYSFLDPSYYRSERLKVLTSLLEKNERDDLYLHPAWSFSYKETASYNLRSEIHNLSLVI